MSGIPSKVPPPRHFVDDDVDDDFDDVDDDKCVANREILDKFVQ